LEAKTKKGKSEMERTMLGLTLSMVIGLFTGCDALAPRKMTAEQYSAIKMGMTEDEVRQLAGEPNGKQEVDVGGARARARGHSSPATVWYYNGVDVGITFQRGKVISKAEDGLGVGSEGKGFTYP
jgi:hypothetical protein